MKNNKFILALSLLGILGISGAVIASGIANGEVGTEQVAVKADTTTYRIYCDKGAMATKWTGKIYVRYYTGETDNKSGYYEATKVNDNVYYYDFTNPSVFTTASDAGFCFRNTDTGSDDDNETAWISSSYFISNSYNLIWVGSELNGGRRNGNWLKGADITATYTDPTGPSYLTKRIWTRAETDNNNDWYWRNARTAIRTWDSENAVTVYKTTAILDNSYDGIYYWYADIPVALANDHIQFCQLDENLDAIIGYSKTLSTITEGYTTAGVIYITTIPTGESDHAISIGAVKNDKCSAEVAARAVEGYTTCLSSDVNGYGAAANLKTNFIDKISDGASKTLADYTYNDYAKHTTGETYVNTETRATSTTMKAKYDELYAKYVAANPSGLLRAGNGDDSTNLLPFFIATLALSAIGVSGVFFYRKKKRVE